MTDGNGIMHQNGCGIASHLGVLLDIPSIGVGKTSFCVDGLAREYVNNLYYQKTKEFGDKINLIGYSGYTWGAAMKLNKKKEIDEPMFISIGHKISLETACRIAKNCW